MKKKIILLSILSLLCLDKTYASCTKEELNEFKKIESEYKVTYEFNKDTKDYTITLHTPYPDKYGYVLDNDMNQIKYVSSTENSVTFSNVKPGNYIIEVHGMSKTCEDILKQINLNLSKYNSYSEDSICDGIEEFVLCQPTYDKEIDYDTFVSRVNTYKKSKQEKESETIQEEVQEENEIIGYIKDNLVQIIVITVFVILVIITTILTVNSIKKSRRLE